MNKPLAKRFHRDLLAPWPTVEKASTLSKRVWHELTHKHFHENLERYGPGITLYYKSALRLCYLFVILSFFSFWSMSINSSVAAAPPPPPPPPPADGPQQETATMGLEHAMLDLEGTIEDNFPPVKRPRMPAPL